ncbi:MAG: LysR family transcriptional regulator [Deltaproteobacteria bacterium]|nr:LysR family transcriptional regulator [Deltaproteobacteria bacterium]
MEWQQIVGFYQVVNFGSITKAAEATFRTQSALSQQISALERELSCLLFERTGKRRLKLTPAGERFLQFADTIINEHKSLIHEIKEIQKGNIGRLRIAAQFAPLYYFFPDIFSTYRTLFPLVDLFILERPPREAMELVREGEVDMAIGTESMVLSDLKTIRLAKVNNFLLVPLHCPIGKSSPITLEEIAQYPLILGPKQMRTIHQRLLDSFEEMNIPYQIIMESSNLVLTSRYIEMGLGVTIFSEWFGVDIPSRKQIRVISIDHIIKPDYVAIVMRKEKKLQIFQTAFLMILHNKLAEIGPVSKNFLNNIAAISDSMPNSQDLLLP